VCLRLELDVPWRDAGLTSLRMLQLRNILQHRVGPAIKVQCTTPRCSSWTCPRRASSSVEWLQGKLTPQPAQQPAPHRTRRRCSRRSSRRSSSISQLNLAKRAAVVAGAACRLPGGVE
jgi:hypothetical protein